MKHSIARSRSVSSLDSETEVSHSSSVDSEDSYYTSSEEHSSSYDEDNSDVFSVSDNEEQSDNEDIKEILRANSSNTLIKEINYLHISQESIEEITNNLSLTNLDDSSVITHLDDSTDEETSEKIAENGNLLSKKWESLSKAPNKLEPFINDDENKAKKLMDSFLLHSTGISLLYDKGVLTTYYSNKKSKLAPSFDIKEVKQQVIASLISSIRNLCLSIYVPGATFAQLSAKAKLVYENKGVNEYLSKFADDIIKDRVFGKSYDTRIDNIMGRYEDELFANIISRIRQVYKLKENDDIAFSSDSTIHAGLKKLALIKCKKASKDKNSVSILPPTIGGYKSPTQYVRSKSYEEILHLHNEKFPNELQEFSKLCRYIWERVREIDTNRPVVEELKKYSNDLFNSFISDIESHQDQQITEIFSGLNSHIRYQSVATLSKSLTEHISYNLSNLKIRRPILQEEQALKSNCLKTLLANIRLSNRSQTRLIRNSFDEEGFKLHGESILRYWKFSASSTKAAMETQQITTNQARNDIIGNMGAYDDVLKDIIKLKIELKITDKDIAFLMKQILKGIELENININGKGFILKEVHKKILVNLVALMFVTETARSPSSIVANLMICDLIEAEKISWAQALDCYELKDGKRDGGLSPMTMKNAVSAARFLNKKFEIPYTYQGEESEDVGLVQKLIDRESLVVEYWIKLVKTNDNTDRHTKKDYSSAKVGYMENFAEMVNSAKARWLGEGRQV